MPTPLVRQGHLKYYVYQHDQPEPLTITVTPTYGNPDLYVNLGASPGALLLPDTLRHASFQQTSPGDDALTILLPGIPTAARTPD